MLSTFLVNSADDAGSGSLRQAILGANTNPGLDTIAFEIGQGGAQSIGPLSALPTITDPAVIDGTTQPGYAGRPIIELTGGQAGALANGLRVTSGNTTIRGLVINGFAQYGILLENSGNNLIAGNFLGTDLTGTIGRANRSGLRIANNSNQNTIGGTTAADRNLVSGNVFASISLSSVSGNVVQGNYLGTDVTGTSGMGASGDSLSVSGSDNVIGGTLPGAGNLISKGVTLTGRSQRLQGNYIGTDVTGTRALGLGEGIFTNGTDHLIGGSEPGAGNLISGNPLYGILITGPGAARVVVQGNYIGTDITGTRALPNGSVLNRSAVRVGGIDHLIGGTTPEARNLVSGNTGFGVELAPGARGNRIQGNYIGTDVTGTVAIPNAEVGVLIGQPAGGSNENLIGGTEPGAGNLISGNDGGGLTLYGRDNRVQGNFIGTDVTGLRALANRSSGVGVASGSAGFVRNLVGGLEPGAGNLIAGNQGYGVSIGGGNAGGEHRVQGNFIGTDITGTRALPNLWGVVVGYNGFNNLVGGTDPGAGNLISANLVGGVGLTGSGNVAQGNRIGTDVSGTQPLGNGTYGVTLGLTTSTANTLGGTQPGAGNLIAFNGRDGVYVDQGLRNALRGNAIWGHGNGLGIRLLNNGNNNQAAPQLLAAGAFRGRLTVAGTLRSAASTAYALEFFASPSCHPSGFGEGQQPVGTWTVTTDAAGDSAFVAAFDSVVPRGWVVTATATDPAGNTSAFSGCALVRSRAYQGRPLADNLVPFLGGERTPRPVTPADTVAARQPMIAAAPLWPAARVPAAAAQVRDVVFAVRGRAFGFCISASTFTRSSPATRRTT